MTAGRVVLAPAPHPVYAEWLTVDECRQRVFPADTTVDGAGTSLWSLRCLFSALSPLAPPAVLACQKGTTDRGGRILDDARAMATALPTPQSLSPASPRPSDLHVLRNILQRAYARRNRARSERHLGWGASAVECSCRGWTNERVLGRASLVLFRWDAPARPRSLSAPCDPPDHTMMDQQQGQGLADRGDDVDRIAGVSDVHGIGLGEREQYRRRPVSVRARRVDLRCAHRAEYRRREHLTADAATVAATRCSCSSRRPAGGHGS